MQSQLTETFDGAVLELNDSERLQDLDHRPLLTPSHPLPDDDCPKIIGSPIEELTKQLRHQCVALLSKVEQVADEFYSKGEHHEQATEEFRRMAEEVGRKAQEASSKVEEISRKAQANRKIEEARRRKVEEISKEVRAIKRELELAKDKYMEIQSRIETYAQGPLSA